MGRRGGEFVKLNAQLVHPAEYFRLRNVRRGVQIEQIRRRPVSLLAGKLADRVGRTTVTIASMAVSGACALAIGFFYHAGAAALAVVAIVWGFAVVADSAQFSACVSELCEREYLGTALTLQTSLGFLLTMLTIRLVPLVEARIGTQWSFSVLALGPAAGIVAMLALRRLPEAKRIAGGKR